MATKESWKGVYKKRLQKLESKGPRTIGERLKVLRYRSGKSINDVSRETTIAYASLYHWETDANMPMLRELIIIAEYYGVTLDYLVLGKG